jgi:lipopolysaccharide transport system permease protein
VSGAGTQLSNGGAHDVVAIRRADDQARVERWTLSPPHVAVHLLRLGRIVGPIARREVAARYRGSRLGGVWAVLDPLVVFVLYAFVFSVVFQARWGDDSSRTGYAFALFAGLTVYGLLSDPAAAAASLVFDYRSFVRRALFPLEALPLARFLSSAVPSLMSTLLLLVALAAFGRGPHWTWALVPLVLAPPALFGLGAVYAISSIGVFVRDLAHVVRWLLLAGLFLSPIFYPADRLPGALRTVQAFNPVTHLVRDFRRVVLEGEPPLWGPYLAILAVALAFACLSFAGFHRARRLFADVL